MDVENLDIGMHSDELKAIVDYLDSIGWAKSYIEGRIFIGRLASFDPRYNSLEIGDVGFIVPIKSLSHLKKVLLTLGLTKAEEQNPLEKEARKVVFFTIKDGKYMTKNGIEITIEMLVKHSHYVTGDGWSYIVLD